MTKFLTILLLTTFSMGFSLAQSQVLKPRVDKAVFFDISPPLRDQVSKPVTKDDNSWKDGVIRNYFDPTIGMGQKAGLPDFTDLAIQHNPGMLPSDTTLQNFDGLGNGSGSVPPDTHGEAGPNHYFQVVNTSYAIFNKTGNMIFGPRANSSIWNGLPNNQNSGDAVVLYDETANRWLFTQFSLPNYPNGPFFQMIAVSQTPDPTGSWYRWEYQFSQMPDYPKFGVWPDGYYMSANRFAGGWTGTGAYAYDRTAMLAGDPAAQRISFEFLLSGEGFITMIPSDCDGAFPPAGTPNYFSYIKTNGLQHLGIYEFHVDWTNPANATFGNSTYLNVTPFATLATGVPQKNTTILLDGISDRLMYGTKYRKFNTHNALVLNHTVSAAGGAAGVRWYELRKTGGGGWSIYQQSTYAPADNKSRWMGSIAIDTAGTIALGYSVSSSTMFPAIRYTGRLKTDPVNTMTMAEKTIVQGGGSQTGIWSGRSRWGDYSAMSVDPSSPTTFWYTTEYYASTSTSNWQTRIGSFTFGNVFSISTSAFPSSICIGDSAQLRTFAYGGSGTYTYAWTSLPAGYTSTLPDPIVSPTVSTRYQVSVNDGSQTKTDTVRVNVTQLPTAYAGPDTSVCSYVPSISLHGTATNYRMCGWGTSGNGHFSTTSGLDAVYTFGSTDRTNGWVDLIFIALPISPCSGNVVSMRHVVIDPCTGLPEGETGGLKMQILPNPARELVTVTLTGLSKAVAEITITSMDGRLMASATLAPDGIKTEKRFDLSGFRKGVYLIKLKTGDEVKTERLVVQ